MLAGVFIVEASFACIIESFLPRVFSRSQEVDLNGKAILSACSTWVFTGIEMKDELETCIDNIFSAHNELVLCTHCHIKIGC